MIKKLGSGTYGTVYRPYPISCHQTRSLTPPRNYIGKISNDRTASQQDYKRLQKIRKMIDPAQFFTIPLKAICKKSPANDANIYWRSGNIEYVFPYGGISYDRLSYKKIRKNPLCVKYLFLSFHPIIRGLMEMRKRNIMHLDIKPPNLVYNIETNETRLIDYDLMVDVVTFEKRFIVENAFRDTFYIYWPPEINFNENINAATPPSPYSYNTQTPFGKNLIPYLTQYKQTSVYKKNEYIPSRFDIYSLGIVWAELFWDTVPEIWGLTQQMMHFDPRKRMTVSQLHDAYFNIFNSIIKEISD